MTIAEGTALGLDTRVEDPDDHVVSRRHRRNASRSGSSDAAVPTRVSPASTAAITSRIASWDAVRTSRSRYQRGHDIELGRAATQELQQEEEPDLSWRIAGMMIAEGTALGLDTRVEDPDDYVVSRRHRRNASRSGSSDAAVPTWAIAASTAAITSRIASWDAVRTSRSRYQRGRDIELGRAATQELQQEQEPDLS